ncbi:MAG: hypothetical protein ACR5KW_02690 [Wolbachia sp.]
MQNESRIDDITIVELSTLSAYIIASVLLVDAVIVSVDNGFCVKRRKKIVMMFKKLV